MKNILIIVLAFFVTGFISAQEATVGGPDPTRIGIETAQQFLREVTVDNFEHDGFWRSHISSDFGFATSRLFESPGSSRKQPIPEEEALGIPDRFVLGTRVDFLRRGHSSVFIYPTRPIPIEGITKTLSVWVAGRNFNHRLYILIQDFFGRHFEFFMGRLNFQGWQQLTVAIPPQADDGLSGVVQRNIHHQHYSGIRVTGFRIDFDPMQARGSYYVYFDALRAVTDLFAENNRDPDDMVDGW